MQAWVCVCIAFMAVHRLIDGLTGWLTYLAGRQAGGGGCGNGGGGGYADGGPASSPTEEDQRGWGHPQAPPPPQQGSEGGQVGGSIGGPVGIVWFMCAKSLCGAMRTVLTKSTYIQGRGRYGGGGGGGGGGGAGSPQVDRCNLIVNYLPNELTDDGLRVRWPYVCGCGCWAGWSGVLGAFIRGPDDRPIDRLIYSLPSKRHSKTRQTGPVPGVWGAGVRAHHQGAGQRPEPRLRLRQGPWWYSCVCTSATRVYVSTPSSRWTLRLILKSPSPTTHTKPTNSTSTRRRRRRRC